MQVVISGYYGYGNSGDEAVLAGIIGDLRARRPDVRICVLSGDPRQTRSLHGVEAIHRYNWEQVWQVMRAARLLISGGGSLFQDVTSWRSPAYYAGVITMARALRVPVFFYAQGIGPLDTRMGRCLTRLAANRAVRITVRDEESAGFLEALRVSRPVKVTADPAFSLEPDNSSRVEQLWQKADAGGRPVIGFALRPWRGIEKRVSDIAAVINWLESRFGCKAVLIPMRHGHDRVLAERLVRTAQAGTVLGVEGTTPAELLALFGRMSLVVGMRLHSIILAARQLVPVVAVNYDPKVASITHALEQGPLLDLTDLTYHRLCDEISRVWYQRLAIARALEPRIARLKEASRATAGMAMAVVER